MDSSGTRKMFSQGDDYFLWGDSHLDANSYSWEGENGNEDDDLLHMFDEMTPAKSCAEFNYDISNKPEEDIYKVSGECQSFQSKRRRMLLFDSDSVDPTICNEQSPYTHEKPMDKDNSMEIAMAENMQWVQSFSEEDGCGAVGEGFDQLSEGFLVNCLNENEIPLNCDELIASEPSHDEVEISELPIGGPVTQTGAVQELASPAPRSYFKVISSRKADMRTPTKLASIAYPFALIKPCGAKGDVTLKDINQRIHTPLVRSKHKEEEAPPSYPTSAFSGKPVVVKTKIHTEGGKGSITIMRTKG